MQSTKRILAGLACAFLPFILISFGSLASTYKVLGQPDHIKQALSQSGVYGAFLDASLDQVAKDAAASSTQSASPIPADQPAVRKVIERAIPPAYLEQQTNGVIDAVFAWLHGNTPKPQFTFDLSQAKTKLADGMGQYALDRMNSLPTCSPLEDIPGSLDPLSATCLPAHFDKAAAAQDVRNQIANSQDFLKDSVITADDLQKDTGTGQSLQLGNTRLDLSPDTYSSVRFGMYATGIAAVVLGAGIVLLSATRRQGIRRVGIIAVIVGGLCSFLAWSLGFLLGQVVNHVQNSLDTNTLERSIASAVRLLTQDIRNWWLMYGLCLLGAGVVSLIVLRVMRRKQTIASHALTPGQIKHPRD